MCSLSRRESLIRQQRGICVKQADEHSDTRRNGAFLFRASITPATVEPLDHGAYKKHIMMYERLIGRVRKNGSIAFSSTLSSFLLAPHWKMSLAALLSA